MCHLLHLDLIMEVRSRKGVSKATSSATKHNEVVTQVSKPKERKLLSVCLKCLLPFLLIYALSAVVFTYSTWIQRELIYVNRIRTPFFSNLSNPYQFGLHNETRHFYLMHKGNECRIGVWYIPRMTNIGTANDVASLADGFPVVLYLHGNLGTRGTYPRVGVYKYLSEERNCHVVTFDYRGFGDSDCYPSEVNMMEDGLLVWEWIRKKAPNARIYLWGHSLGSGAATHLTLGLQSLGTTPVAVLLDAPFTNIIEAAYNHPFGIPFKPLGERFYHSMYEKHSSIDRILHIKCDIMIFHSRNDFVVPYHLGKKLYETAISKRDPKITGKVSFIDCGEQGHKYNYLSKELRVAVDKFIQ